jgi:hypothetical protein
MQKIRARWRAYAAFCTVGLLVVTLLVGGFYLLGPGWRLDKYAIEMLWQSAEEAFIEDGPGEVSENAAAEGSEEFQGFYLVEDSLTGEAVKRTRKPRGPEFKRWTRYKILDSYEMAGRLVAGLKESKSIIIRIQPKGRELPDVEQLQEIAELLKSSTHHSTYVYYYLPGMELKHTPWATVFQQADRPTSVSFDKSHMPEMFRETLDNGGEIPLKW